MGTMANELSLGCDCLGQIHYLPGAFVGHNGKAIVIKNVICIHEEDAGVLWKHTDYRPGGRSQTVRRKEEAARTRRGRYLGEVSQRWIVRRGRRRSIQLRLEEEITGGT